MTAIILHYIAQNDVLEVMLRKALYDPSFWMLLLINIYCIYYFNSHTEGFSTIVWIYWIQSVLIGFFNFLDLLTVKNGDPGSMSINDKPFDNSASAKGCSSFFFLFHYQAFHIAYAVFILIQVKGVVDFNFLRISLAIIILELTINFIRAKRYQAQFSVNYGQLFFMPYLRIIPMHLMILAPAFLGFQASTVFLVLKMFADIGMYLLTQRLYRKVIPVT